MTTNLTHPAIQLRQMNPTARLTPTGNYAEIYVGTLTLTFSYETVIAVAIPGIGRIGTKQRWSTTTSKHQRAAGPYRFEVDAPVFDSIVAALQIGIDRALTGGSLSLDGVTMTPYAGIRATVADILQNAGLIDAAERTEMIGAPSSWADGIGTVTA